MVHEIRHCFYHSDHDAALRSFDLPKEQQRFTALPAEALNACAKEPERKPIVILHQERRSVFLFSTPANDQTKAFLFVLQRGMLHFPMKCKKSSLFSSIDVRLIGE
ncbi:hypothetical protein [Geobacillus sp. Sah69]|uniref:hypothetical protein n=1 Tax=Geobacillus sp. Sah69 TaxID=1737624 RepID=UPI000A9D280B|nr:hypothetical protein [Geobacillus sp. Sah69]